MTNSMANAAVTPVTVAVKGRAAVTVLPATPESRDLLPLLRLSLSAIKPARGNPQAG